MPIKLTHINRAACSCFIRELVLLDEIDPAKFVRINANFKGCIFDQPFHQISSFGPPRAAVGIGRRCIAVNTFHIGKGCLNIIKASRHAGAKPWYQRPKIRKIGPHIRQNFNIKRDKPIVFIKPQTRR